MFSLLAPPAILLLLLGGVICIAALAKSPGWFIILATGLTILCISLGGYVSLLSTYNYGIKSFKACSNKMIALQYCVDSGRADGRLVEEILSANDWLEKAKKDKKKFYGALIPAEVDNLKPYDIDSILKKSKQVEKVP